MGDKELTRLIEGLHKIQVDYKDINLPQIIILLGIVREAEGITIDNLCVKLDMPRNNVNRFIKKYSDLQTINPCLMTKEKRDPLHVYIKLTSLGYLLANRFLAIYSN